jgi:hypothetical protein
MVDGARAERRAKRSDGVHPGAMPLEDRPTPIVEPAASLLAEHAVVPLEERPTPIGEVVRTIPATPPALPPPPAVAARAKPPTGPQLPSEPSGEIDDAPTVLSATTPEREDPTDLGETHIVPHRALAAFVDLDPPRASEVVVHPPVVRFFAPQREHATSVVSRTHAAFEAPVRMWLALCCLFVIAIIVASVVALL